MYQQFDWDLVTVKRTCKRRFLELVWINLRPHVKSHFSNEFFRYKEGHPTRGRLGGIKIMFLWII